MIRLAELHSCFQGVVPSIITTADARGVPNVTYISQVHVIDEAHVALSRQFFNKTIRNLIENPRALVEVWDPLTYQPYQMKLHFLRSETSGPLFESMAVRIEAIASHTGMTGVFRLIASDVFRVESVEKIQNFFADQSEREPEAEVVSVDGLRSEVRGLQLVSESINQATDLESLLENVLVSLEHYFGFEHTMILLHDEQRGKLVTIASRGYGTSGVGAEVAIGEGLIGTAANQRHVLRINGLDSELRYGRTIRKQVGATAPEIALPGLPDAQSALIIPLTICNRLVGVIAAEDRDSLRFGEWHEAYLEVVANQIALGIDRMTGRQVEDDVLRIDRHAIEPVPAPQGAAPRTLTYYRNDDCVFLDDEYLIRNVPGRILWKLLREWEQQGRTEFSNRELRLDERLGLPQLKDNLESRLLLLRRRLDEKCPELKIVSTGRGRFALRVAAPVHLVEK